jgi:hypothetical protein
VQNRAIFLAARRLLPHPFSQQAAKMDNRPAHVNEGFDRLQRLLLAMRAGDDLRAADAAQVTGLSGTICLAVLEGLQRAGLMEHAGDDRFIRCSLDLMPS